MAACFYDHVFCAGFYHFACHLGNCGGVGGGEVCVGAIESGVVEDGADKAAGLVGVFHGGAYEEGDGGFSVGSGYCEVCKFLSGVFEACLSEQCCGEGGVFDENYPGVVFLFVFLCDDVFRVVFEGLVDEVVSVELGTFYGDEDIAGSDGPGVAVDFKFGARVVNQI